jgi:hypothetical protein
MTQPPAAEHRIGLRFDRSETRALNKLADRARQRDIAGMHAAIFDQAAQAASTGEPLIVVCSNPIEAALIAHGYTRFGIRAPVIEGLT